MLWIKTEKEIKRGQTNFSLVSPSTTKTDVFVLYNKVWFVLENLNHRKTNSYIIKSIIVYF